MTGERQKCPTGDLTGDRHQLGARRWTLTDPSGQVTALCSATCAIMWVSYATPVDVEAWHSVTVPGGEAA